MTDVLETDIDFPVKVYFEFQKAEPMTRHYPGSDAFIEIEAIEICGIEITGDLYMAVEAAYKYILKDEIREKVEKWKQENEH